MLYLLVLYLFYLIWYDLIEKRMWLIWILRKIVSKYHEMPEWSIVDHEISEWSIIEELS